MKQDIVPMMIRLPKDLRDWLAALAQAERRSLNGQVITLLERAMAAIARPQEVRQ
ncbi:Arc family DNA-binding protein [Achromobacter xylosoxidans]|uniref:Arc family DNA-binding protein n=1 Tax=Alcaligenes xylosoxydans xylosoxydans TaxID=85698 RepID=UPI003EE41DD0